MIKIGISVGDLNGIGMEVIIKTLSHKTLIKKIAPIIYGSVDALNQHVEILGLDRQEYFIIKDSANAKIGIINIINIWTEKVEIEIGAPTPRSGKYAVESLEAATQDLKAGKIHALVTAPISKEAVYSNTFPYKGHTEYLAKEFGNTYLMLLVQDDLRVGVVTGHIPLDEVSKKVTKALILEKLKILHRSLMRDFGLEKGIIAVLGLNPHAGDAGVIGQDELQTIEPAIAEARRQGILAFGPFAADGIFGSGQYKKYDAVLAMYHDQGLIPFKTLAFEEGVNYTAGLSAVRTSPDHGTAFDIAGKTAADASSFTAALMMAYDIVKSRKSFDEDHHKPLVKIDRHFEDEIVKDDM